MQEANSWAYCQVDAVLAVFVKPKWANITLHFVYFDNATYHNLSIQCFADVLDWSTATSYLNSYTVWHIHMLANNESEGRLPLIDQPSLCLSFFTNVFPIIGQNIVILLFFLHYKVISDSFWTSDVDVDQQSHLTKHGTIRPITMIPVRPWVWVQFCLRYRNPDLYHTRAYP
jgi:hypothetical protein